MHKTMLPALHLSLTEFIILIAFLTFLVFPGWLLRLIYAIETIRRLWGKGPR
jgi:hypothetical protein